MRDLHLISSQDGRGAVLRKGRKGGDFLAIIEKGEF